jgi:putative sigma-54 modulation protein
VNIQLSTKGLTADDDLRSYVERRVLFGLGRFASRLRRVGVRLEDGNGPRGGPDMACRVVLGLDTGGTLQVTERDAELRPGVDRAVDRAARNLVRHLEKEREDRKI